MLSSRTMPQADRLDLVHAVSKYRELHMPPRKKLYYLAAARMLNLNSGELAACDADPEIKRQIYSCAIERMPMVSYLVKKLNLNSPLDLLDFKSETMAKHLLEETKTLTLCTAARRCDCIKAWIRQAKNGF